MEVRKLGSCLLPLALAGAGLMALRCTPGIPPGRTDQPAVVRSTGPDSTYIEALKEVQGDRRPDLYIPGGT